MAASFSRRVIAAAASAALGMAALGFPAAAAQAAPVNRLVLAVRGEPEQGFDPIKGWGEYGNPLFQSTLLKLDAKLNLVGDLATKWHISPDGKIWTITLRQDAKFADGKPVTAEDVVFTYETGRNAASKVDLTNLESVRAVDGKTVQMQLKVPQVTFSHNLATIGIVPKHAYGDRYAEAPMGSGPFRFVSWQRGQQLIVEPNPHYYGKKPAFERVTFLFTQEDATVAAAHNGQVHVAVVPPAFAQRVPAAMNRVAVKSVDNRGIMFPTVPATGKKTAEGYDLGNDVTADVAIRKAINIAIDRKKLTEGVLRGYGTPAWGIADSLPWDNPDQRLSDNDLAGARRLLQQAGWKPNAQGVLEKNGKEARFTLMYFSNDSTRQALALAVADMVKPLGIVIDVAGKTREEVRRLKHVNAVLYGWGAHTPREVYKLYEGSQAGKGSYNAGFYDNPAVNGYLNAAEKSTSLNASLPLWRKAMWDGKTGLGMKGDAAWAWLVNLDHIYFVNKCLDIGPRQIEPHGHGYPVTWNIQDWKWTCR